MNNSCFKNSFGHRTVYRTLVIVLLACLSLTAVAYAQGQRPGLPPTPGAGAYAHAHGTSPAVSPPASGPAPQGRKTSAGEQFYIVASLDQSKSQLLLKLPSEVTMLMSVTGKTQIQDENGAPLKLSDLRAGDTVWVISSGSAAEPAAVRIRKGQMTVADLHRYFLDYPEIK
ncbi:MAG: hypothetical protein ABR973_05420 [Candidatus Acidiferrales bacterium]|jgi:hypothetical protein